MSAIENLHDILTSRSFSSIWYWITLAGCWSFAARNPFGVPDDLRQKARAEAKAPDAGTEAGPNGLAFLDWLSLTLPRWTPEGGQGVVAFGLGVFALVILGLLGFRYGFEFAQAVTLLLAPLGLMMIDRVALARRLAQVLARANAGQISPTEAVRICARRIALHRLGVGVFAVLVVLLTAFLAVRWIVTHPFGF